MEESQNYDSPDKIEITEKVAKHQESKEEEPK